MCSKKTSVHGKEGPCERDVCILSQATLQLKHNNVEKLFRIPNKNK